eukprot:4334932-Pleurochrysis_carterae.AAC.2
MYLSFGMHSGFFLSLRVQCLRLESLTASQPLSFHQLLSDPPTCASLHLLMSQAAPSTPLQVGRNSCYAGSLTADGISNSSKTLGVEQSQVSTPRQRGFVDARGGGGYEKCSGAPSGSSENGPWYALTEGGNCACSGARGCSLETAPWWRCEVRQGRASPFHDGGGLPR